MEEGSRAWFVRNFPRIPRLTGGVRPDTANTIPDTSILCGSFFNRPTLEAARQLIGMLLVHSAPEGLTAGIIVETEGYEGASDPGSHAFRGPGKRNAPMFGPPGRAYVYKCHKYPLLNVVTEKPGRPGAVLLRALQPVAGIRIMLGRRGNRPLSDLAKGPGCLTSAMGIGLEHNRLDLSRGQLHLCRPRAIKVRRVVSTTRIGLNGAAARLPWRFLALENPFVSHV